MVVCERPHPKLIDLGERKDRFVATGNNDFVVVEVGETFEHPSLILGDACDDITPGQRKAVDVIEGRSNVLHQLEALVAGPLEAIAPFVLSKPFLQLVVQIPQAFPLVFFEEADNKGRAGQPLEVFICRVIPRPRHGRTRRPSDVASDGHGPWVLRTKELGPLEDVDLAITAVCSCLHDLVTVHKRLRYPTTVGRGDSERGGMGEG